MSVSGTSRVVFARISRAFPFARVALARLVELARNGTAVEQAVPRTVIPMPARLFR